MASQVQEHDRHLDDVRLKQLADKALLGYGYIGASNYAEIEHKYKCGFGKYNRRELHQPAVKLMAKEFEAGAAEYWKFPIPIVVEKEWIEQIGLSSSLNIDGDLRQVISDIQWTDKVIGQTVHHLNGRHRFAAMELALRNIIKEKTALEEQLAKRKEGGDAWTSLTAQVGEKNTRLAGLGRWIAAVYDSSKLSALSLSVRRMTCVPRSNE